MSALSTSMQLFNIVLQALTRAIREKRGVGKLGKGKEGSIQIRTGEVKLSLFAGDMNMTLRGRC